MINMIKILLTACIYAGIMVAVSSAFGIIGTIIVILLVAPADRLIRGVIDAAFYLTSEVIRIINGFIHNKPGTEDDASIIAPYCIVMMIIGCSLYVILLHNMKTRTGNCSGLFRLNLVNNC